MTMEKKTILIIDDAADVRKILKFHLEKKYNVLEAADGEEGLEKFYAKSPDLLILDINMPRMGGLAVYNKISARKGKPEVPVIILTVREELGKLFKDLDASGFVTKPFQMDVVLREIDTVMARYYGTAVLDTQKPPQEAKKILIVEDDADAFSMIAIAFLNAGYMVNPAKSGIAAVEKIMTDIPDFIVIKLGLPDISGDLVCVKLKQMPKTMDIPFLLYTPANSILDRVVVKKICEIIGASLLESGDPAVLLAEVEKALQKPNQ